MAKAAIHRTVASGRLIRVHPGVYSTIPPELMTVEARHAAAILAGGTGACLCADSAGWWLAVVKDAPDQIHVAVRGRPARVAGIRWHRLALREGERGTARDMPVTAPARVPVDLAADLSVWELKGLLAELEYRHGVGPDAVVPRPGVPGMAKLRRALAEHTPQLARTRDELERRAAEFLVARGFVLPRFNHPVGKSTVDAVYEKEGVVIELDGVRGHSGERRVLRDHRRDLHRRADGFVVLRYHFTQVTTPADQALIEAELDRLGVPRLDDELGRSGSAGRAASPNGSARRNLTSARTVP